MQLQLMLARSYLALRRWEDAEAAARAALAVDPHDPQAHLVIARCGLRTGRLDQAAEAAAASIGLQFGNPHGHFMLGAALAAQGRFTEAVRPLENALELAPLAVVPRRMLARVQRRLGHGELAAMHEARSFEAVHELRRRQAAQAAAVRESAAARAATRSEQDRIRQAEIERLKAEYDAVEPQDS